MDSDHPRHSRYSVVSYSKHQSSELTSGAEPVGPLFQLSLTRYSLPRAAIRIWETCIPKTHLFRTHLPAHPLLRPGRDAKSRMEIPNWPAPKVDLMLSDSSGLTELIFRRTDLDGPQATTSLLPSFLAANNTSTTFQSDTIERLCRCDGR